MLESAIAQGMFKLLLGLIGVLLGRATLMWMDGALHHRENEFSIWLDSADDKAKAIYYGSRLVFVGLIIGAAIG